MSNLAASNGDFRINPKNYLKGENKVYQQRILHLALTKTEDYFEMRANVLAAVTEKLVTSLYDTFFDLMTNGTIDKTNAAGAKYEDIFVPRVPNQEVTKFALDAVETMEEIVEVALQKILPDHPSKIAEERLRRQGEKSIP